MKAAEFIGLIRPLVGFAREKVIKDALEKECVPAFLTSNFVDITIKDGENILVYKVYPDYLSIGENDDYLRMPMCPMTAKSYMEKHNLMLPTPRMVDQIYRHGVIKPLGRAYSPKKGQPNRDSTHWYIESNKIIQTQIGVSIVTQLVAGHKKDVVLVNKPELKTKVCIYGWMDKNGNPIQPISTIHTKDYVDYSHGLRMVSRECLLNGRKVDLYDDIMTNKDLCTLVHPEPLKRRSYE